MIAFEVVHAGAPYKQVSSSYFEVSKIVKLFVVRDFDQLLLTLYAKGIVLDTILEIKRLGKVEE